MNLNILQDLHVNNQSLLKAKMFSDSYFGTRRVSFDMSVLSCVYKRSSCKILKEKLEETFFFGGGVKHTNNDMLLSHIYNGCLGRWPLSSTEDATKLVVDILRC